MVLRTGIQSIMGVIQIPRISVNGSGKSGEYLFSLKIVMHS